MNDITKTVEWHDPDTTDTVWIAAKAYGIHITGIKKTSDENTISAEVSGPEDKVMQFSEDVEDGDNILPFDVKGELSDNEYYDWLESELKKFNCNFKRPTEY